jgi:long-chain acyl-CoA synthetase
VYIVGRKDDLIIRGGENISPTEIEDTLLRHPDVTSAVVVGLPDPDWGERIAAMIVTRPGASSDVTGIQSWMKSNLGSLKTPDLIVTAAELPTTPTGKIVRRQVIELLTYVGQAGGRLTHVEPRSHSPRP